MFKSSWDGQAGCTVGVQYMVVTVTWALPTAQVELAPPACRGGSLWGHTPQTVPGYRELSLKRLLCVLLLGWVHEQAKMGVGAEAPASELEAKQKRATTVPSPSAFSPANLSPSLLLPGVALLGTDT